MAQPVLKPLPKNWPKDVHFLTAPFRSSDLTTEQLTALRTPPSSSTATTTTRTTTTQQQQHPAVVPATYPRGPNPWVEIRPITDPAHPACGQAGLFAARRLEAGTLVLPYLGELHRGGGSGGSDPDSDSDYDLWVSRDADVAVDAARCGNEARFVNDYRGVAPRPNAEFRDVWDPRWRYPDLSPAAVARGGPAMAPRAGEWGVAVFVLPLGKKAASRRQRGGIEKGDEILVSYGKGFWEQRKQD